jgi:hypothetical protein
MLMRNSMHTRIRLDLACPNLLVAGLSLVVTGHLLGGTEDAAALVARTLAVNKAWLDPPPVQGHYQLWWPPMTNQSERVQGPFSFEGEPSNGWERFSDPYRVGSMVWTPLHVMASGKTPYTVIGEGSTNWNGVNAVIIDVAFATNVSCAVGMGGQANVSYSECNYHQIRSARLLIDPTNAVPLWMQTATSPTNTFQYSPIWNFDPTFLAANGGLAPQSLDWSEPTTFVEHQDFQVVEGVWIFKSGWSEFASQSPFGQTGFIQAITLTNLVLYIPVPLSVTTAGATLVFTLADQHSGYHPEVADSPQGPWSSAAAQISPNGLIITVPMGATSKPQFYRLTKPVE